MSKITSKDRSLKVIIATCSGLIYLQTVIDTIQFVVTSTVIINRHLVEVGVHSVELLRVHDYLANIVLFE